MLARESRSDGFPRVLRIDSRDMKEKDLSYSEKDVKLNEHNKEHVMANLTEIFREVDG